MTEKKLTIAGIGLGAVGSILAAHLAEAGADIVAADLAHRIAQIDHDGLRVQWGDKWLNNHVKTVKSITDIKSAKPDIIFISTKAWVLNSILPLVSEAASEDTLVISVQNGVGTEDLIAEYIPADNVARMVVNYAGSIDENGLTTVNWFNPPNFFGPVTHHDDPRLKQLVRMLSPAGLTSELVGPDEVKKMAFLKTILNCALMPVCAVLGVTMKQAMKTKATRQLAGDLLREGLTVGARLGYHYGEDAWKNCMAYLDKGGDHHPSMWVDLQNKLPTEIEFVNGKILEIGSMFSDLTLEVNRVFVSLVMAKEVKNGTRKPDQIPDYLLEIS